MPANFGAWVIIVVLTDHWKMATLQPFSFWFGFGFTAFTNYYSDQMATCWDLVLQNISSGTLRLAMLFAHEHGGQCKPGNVRIVVNLVLVFEGRR